MISWSPEVRPEPLSCKACGGRKLQAHCASPACGWRRCDACDAVNGVVACYRDGKFSRFVRAAFGANPHRITGDFKSD